MFTLLQAATSAAAKKGGFDWTMIIMIVAMFAIVYFFMIRPQRKKQKEIENFRKSLTIGSKVITASGVYGTIKSLNEGEKYLTIEVAKGVTIQIDRNYVYAEGSQQQQQ
ncbi:MAG: preprotein translocase subunit YajC [Prevotellaceae bacterium]|nr:preprotein translocase subunit YajC [Candidatus Minthosoma equi]